MIHYKLFTSFIWVRLNPLISQNFCSILFTLAISEQIHQLCTTDTLQRLAKFLRIYSANSQKFPPFYCNLNSLGQALGSFGIVLALTWLWLIHWVYSGGWCALRGKFPMFTEKPCLRVAIKPKCPGSFTRAMPQPSLFLLRRNIFFNW